VTMLQILLLAFAVMPLPVMLITDWWKSRRTR
jgi:uncharacterized membrane protein YqjE